MCGLFGPLEGLAEQYGRRLVCGVTGYGGEKQIVLVCSSRRGLHDGSGVVGPRAHQLVVESAAVRPKTAIGSFRMRKKGLVAISVRKWVNVN